MNYNDYDLIITNQATKINILKNYSLNKQFLKARIVTLTEFKNSFYGSVKKSAYKNLIEYLDISISVIDTIIKNAYFDKKLWEYLKTNDLIDYNPRFMIKIKKILVIDVFLDKYILDDLNKYDITFYNDTKEKFNNCVYEFDFLDDEISFSACKILDLLKANIPVNNIKLVNVNDDMITTVKRIFDLYGLNIASKDKNSIFNTRSVRKFVNNFLDLDINLNLGSIHNIEIKNKIIEVINDFELSNESELDLQILKYALKKCYFNNINYKKEIQLIGIEDVINNGDYYFVLGINEGILPRVVKDDDYLDDQQKLKFGINASFQVNKYNTELVYNKLVYIKNLVACYHLKSYFNDYMPSHIISLAHLEVIKNPEILNTYSFSKNVLDYGIMMDKLLKYNDRDKNLNSYYSTYRNLNYNGYSNTFTGINSSKLKKYLHNKLLLSYSSLDNYFHCGFKYYIKNILKLEPYEETFAIMIGNLFHLCLSKMYDDNFDFESEYTNFLNTKKLSNEDKYFSSKLKKDLKFVIDVIKEQESHSKLNQTMTEKKIFVDLSNDIKVTFMGVIDKIKYKDDEYGRTLAIIDYKTGNLETCLDNINYGFHLQLPVYIYLSKKEFKSVNIVGFYLQRILNQPAVDEEQGDYAKKLKLDGFTSNEEKMVSLFDDTYLNSQVIKSLRMASNGWYKNAKVLSENNINYISSLTDNLINDAALNILNSKFDINPKRIDNDLIGCQYCKFNDICYMKEENVINLKNTKLEDILGGENNA